MTTTPTLSWGIKDSLLAYIGRIEDGLIETSAGATRDGDEFQFSFDETASSFDVDSSEGVLQFRGSVIITGHWGSMRVEIHDPRLTLVAGSGDLATSTKSVFGDDRVEAFASVNLTTPAPSLTATTALTAAGRMLMGQQYNVGQELNPLQVIWK